MNTDLLCTGKTLEDTNWGNRGFSETEVNLTEVDDLKILYNKSLFFAFSIFGGVQARWTGLPKLARRRFFT